MQVATVDDLMIIVGVLSLGIVRTFESSSLYFLTLYMSHLFYQNVLSLRGGGDLFGRGLMSMYVLHLR